MIERKTISGGLAWGVWLLALTLVSAGTLLFVAHYPARISGGSLPPPAQLGFVAALLYVQSLGSFVASRRPENPTGWIFAALGVGLALGFLLEHYTIHGAIAQPGSLPGTTWTAWFMNWLGPVAFWLPLLFLLLLFPTGHPLSRDWRVVGWMGTAGVALVALSGSVTPGPMLGIRGLQNPLGLDSYEDALGALVGLGWPLIAVSILLAALSIVLRFRRSRGDERQQLKWLSLSASVVVLGTATSLISDLTFGHDPPELLAAIAPLLTGVGLASIPLSASIAVLKYRLYDIDVIINRTLVYVLLTALLTFTYAVSVVLLQQVLSPVTASSDLAIAGSTLAVAALFRPVRQRVQVFVDRRFYRRKYDAAKTLEAFSARLRDEIDLETLTAELLQALRETVEPSHASRWLRGGATR